MSYLRKGNRRASTPARYRTDRFAHTLVITWTDRFSGPGANSGAVRLWGHTVDGQLDWDEAVVVVVALRNRRCSLRRLVADFATFGGVTPFRAKENTFFFQEVVV